MSSPFALNLSYFSLRRKPLTAKSLTMHSGLEYFHVCTCTSHRSNRKWVSESRRAMAVASERTSGDFIVCNVMCCERLTNPCLWFSALLGEKIMSWALNFSAHLPYGWFKIAPTAPMGTGFETHLFCFLKEVFVRRRKAQKVPNAVSSWCRRTWACARERDSRQSKISCEQN